MSNLSRLACVALVVAEVGAFLPAPRSIPLETTRGTRRSSQGSEVAARTCCVVQPAQQRRCWRDGRSRALYAKKRGKGGGRKQQEDEEEEVTEEMEEYRQAKLAEWKAQIKSGEVRFSPLILLLLLLLLLLPLPES